jgi:hypothetical protein
MQQGGCVVLAAAGAAVGGCDGGFGSCLPWRAVSSGASVLYGDHTLGGAACTTGAPDEVHPGLQAALADGFGSKCVACYMLPSTASLSLSLAA